MSCGCEHEFMGHYGHAVKKITLAAEITPISATALAQDKPVVAAVVTLPCFFRTDGGSSEIVEIRVREKASAEANIRQAALRLALFNQDIAAPAADTVYVPDEAKHIYSALIASGAATAAAPFQGYTRVGQVLREAVIKPGVLVQGVDADARLVLLSDGAVTYPGSGTTIDIDVWVRHHV